MHRQRWMHSMRTITATQLRMLTEIQLQIHSNEVLRYIYEYGYTAEQIASAMSTDINLVALKVAHLATLGYNLHALEHKSNFLK